MTLAIANFLKGLLVHYPVQHASEHAENDWVNSWNGLLKDVPAVVLSEASKQLMVKHRYASFPKPADVLDMVEKARERIALERRVAQAKRTVEEPPRELTMTWEERDRHAIGEMRKDPIGRRAVKEGWHGPCWSWVMRTGKLPANEKDIADCKRQAVDHKAEVSKCFSLAGTFVPKPAGKRRGFVQLDDLNLEQMHAKWGTNILGRWDRIAKEVGK